MRTLKALVVTFNEYGVQIMTPAFVGDPDQLKVAPKHGRDITSQ
jgi:hypothetical protein